MSIGILQSGQKLLEIVGRHSTVTEAIQAELPKILVMQTGEVLDVAVRCSWVESDGRGGLRLSKRGEEIVDFSDDQTRLRLQIVDFLRAVRPVWLSQVPKGRNEALAIMNADARYVLREAGLMDMPPCSDVVAWWDSVAADARSERSGILMEIGRRGERLSIAYEAERTGHQPSWTGVESNLAGYDILSRESRESSEPLPIEVKASNAAIGSAKFHISENEWQVAQTGRDFAFHLWLLQPPVKLAIIRTERMRDHISQNCGEGQWESVKIPMAVFSSEFEPWHGSDDVV